MPPPPETPPDWYRLSHWDEIRSLTASDRALYEASAGDALVRCAFFPEERDFYLRLYRPQPRDHPDHSRDRPDPEPCGVWDVTCNRSTADVLAATLQRESAGPAITASAAVFFSDDPGPRRDRQDG